MSERPRLEICVSFASRQRRFFASQYLPPGHLPIPTGKNGQRKYYENPHPSVNDKVQKQQEATKISSFFPLVL